MDGTEVIAPPKPLEGKPSGMDEGQGKKKKKSHNSSSKSKRKGGGKPGKIHIRLPSIDAYQKEICFPAEAPGRVVVRLERLMGSDKIRPVDGRYMETLIQRLEEEETLGWERKIRLRKKAEKERHRQLAIAGLMEPGPGMEDLYNHPVFRVNRILNRLSKLDNSLVNKPGQKLPPISQIDPFKYDDSGKYFCDYPTHVALRKECERSNVDSSDYADRLIEDMEELNDALALSGPPPRSYVDLGTHASTTSAPPPSEASVAVKKEDDDEDETDEELEGAAPATDDEEEEEMTEMDGVAADLAKEYTESLTSLQNRYGVPQSSNFEEMWKPYRSELIEKFFNDPDSLEQIYSTARQIFEVYTRQDLSTNEHIGSHALTLQDTIAAAQAGNEEEDLEGGPENADEQIEGAEVNPEQDEEVPALSDTGDEGAASDVVEEVISEAAPESDAPADE